MMCAEDVSDLRIKGATGQSAANLPTFSIKRCQSTETKTCKPQTEIDKFIDSHKILMAFNQQEYHSDDIGNINEDGSPAHIKSFTDFNWLFMDSVKPSTRYYSI